MCDDMLIIDRKKIQNAAANKTNEQRRRIGKNQLTSLNSIFIREINTQNITFVVNLFFFWLSDAVVFYFRVNNYDIISSTIIIFIFFM